TLTALEQKLSPGQLLDEAIATLRESAGRTAASLADTVRRHPVPVALGTALVATLLARRGTGDAKRVGDDEPARRWMTLLSAALAQARVASEMGGDRAAEVASDLARDAEQFGGDLRRNVERGVSRLADELARRRRRAVRGARQAAARFGD